uniref:Putative lipocalin-3 1 n=1 Tax=Amblyomma parvum TaxID=251391 RepID=A0A023G2K5_AMBPA
MLSMFVLSSAVLGIFIAPSEQNRITTSRMPLFRTPDISEFVGTPLPIWTYNSTSRANTTCKVDVMVNMSRYHIIFNRSRYEDKRSRRSSSLMDGNFTGFPLDTMAVGELDMLVMQSETIIYESPDYECAVIKVSLRSFGSGWYELRVRNSSVTQGPRWKCQTIFMKYAHNGTKRYWDECQKILGSRNRRRRSMHM